MTVSRSDIEEYLIELSPTEHDRPLDESLRLHEDLGLDSSALIELAAWLYESGAPVSEDVFFEVREVRHLLLAANVPRH